MFGDINNIEIMGNITRDPELKTVGVDTLVCNFSVATNRRYQSGGEWKEDVEFHNVVIWGPRAESFAKRAKKGTRIFVQGRLKTRTWEDKNGSRQYKTEIVVNRVILIDRYEKLERPSAHTEAGGVPVQGTASPVSSAASSTDTGGKQEKKSTAASEEESIDPDDLPF